jgi:hypothetical protein
MRWALNSGFFPGGAQQLAGLVGQNTNRLKEALTSARDCLKQSDWDEVRPFVTQVQTILAEVQQHAHPGGNVAVLMPTISQLWQSLTRVLVNNPMGPLRWRIPYAYEAGVPLGFAGAVCEYQKPHPDFLQNLSNVKFFLDRLRIPQLIPQPFPEFTLDYETRLQGISRKYTAAVAHNTLGLLDVAADISKLRNELDAQFPPP